MSANTFYNWKAAFDGMGVSKDGKMRALQDEDATFCLNENEFLNARGSSRHH